MTEPTDKELLTMQTDIIRDLKDKNHNLGEDVWQLNRKISTLDKQLDSLSTDFAETKNLLDELTSHSEGCMCPNNGGGDCNWCQLAQEAELLTGKHS